MPRGIAGNGTTEPGTEVWDPAEEGTVEGESARSSPRRDTESHAEERAYHSLLSARNARAVTVASKSRL